jgi:hypothetical protein
MFEDANQAAWQHSMAALGLHRRWGMPDRSLDDPVPDVVEQSEEVVPSANDADELEAADLLEVVPLEANPADAAEQAREVEFGEDDYR